MGSLKLIKIFYLSSSFSIIFIIIIIMEITQQATSSCINISGPETPSTPLLTYLEKLQGNALRTLGPNGFDPKLYVDLPLKHDLKETELGFEKLKRNGDGVVSKKELQGFIEEYFDGAGDDLVVHVPVDFVDEPTGFLPKVENGEVRRWALEVHALWKNLSRRVSREVEKKPDRHTLIYLPEPVVVPGSRFREVYYWDSYWVIRGLLASKLYSTAKSIVINLISLIEEYGFVLNGARQYYTNRSQPPLLSSMVHEIFRRTGDMDLLKKALPALLREYRFWNHGIHIVTIKDHEGHKHCLSRYYAMWDKPRPESSTTDEATASKLSNAEEKAKLFRELASAAESGWDFSSRWMRNSSDLTTLATTSILPVDLNAFLLKMEQDIAALAKAIGEKDVHTSFLKAAKARKRAFNVIFWNEEMGQWLDCWISCSPTGKENWHHNLNVFASNFMPLWIELLHSDRKVDKVLKSFEASGLLHHAGIATSLTNTGQQWDFPNGWAPLQHMIIEGLASSRSEKARTMAEDIAVRWIRTNHASYKKTGVMHEKYDVRKCGAYGGGGEYTPQTGFGWTNGVVLALLEEFGWPSDRKLHCE
ncbi:putative trehalase [Drosera capensis]